MPIRGRCCSGSRRAAGEELAARLDPGPVLLGIETRSEFLTRSFNATPCFEALAMETEPGNVLLVGESRAFHSPRLWIGGTSDDKQWLASALSACADLTGQGRRMCLVTSFLSQEVSHVLVNRRGLSRLE